MKRISGTRIIIADPNMVFFFQISSRNTDYYIHEALELHMVDAKTRA